MAKATAQDIECALTIMGQLDDLENGVMPRTGHDENGPVYPEGDDTFDETCHMDCAQALRRILDVFTKRIHGGALMRVIFGMDTVLKNGVFDPAVDHLSWHPDFLPAVHDRERRKAIDQMLAEAGAQRITTVVVRRGKESRSRVLCLRAGAEACFRSSRLLPAHHASIRTLHARRS